MSDVWQRALAPPPHSVLGLELQPLTLGHVYLLSRADSKLLADETEATIQDIVFAAFVCSQPWRISERDLRKRSLKWFMAFWGWRCRKCDWHAQAVAFQGYLDATFEMPDFQGKGQLKTRVTPWWWRLMVILLSQFGLTRDAALDMRVAEANLLWVAKGEMEDTLRMWTGDDDDFWEAAKRHDMEVTE